MTYFGGAGYQPMYQGGFYQQPPAMPDNLAQLRMAQQPQQPQSGGIIWVQGEAGAKSYMVAAGNSVLLMDSENQTFYIKSSDPAGIPSTRIFDYVERTAAPKPQQEQPKQDYITRQEFNALAARVEEALKANGGEANEPAV